MSETSREEAAAALDSIARLEQAGRRAGVYSRAFGLGVAAWTAVMVTTFGLDSNWFGLLLIVGFVVGWLWKRRERDRMGAWVNEVNSWGELAFVVTVGLVVTCVTVAASIASHRGMIWAPWAAGAFSFAVVYGLMEWSYHSVWSQRSETSP